MSASKAKSDIVPADEQETPQYDDHDWTRVDRQIVKWMGKKSVREIAEETGVPQADLMRRKQELVESVDEITLQMQRLQLMATLQEIADIALERAKASVDEFKAGLFNSSVAAVKELLKQVDRLESRGNTAVDALNQLRIREIVRLMGRVVDSGVQEIAQAHGLDEADLKEVFTSRLVLEAAEMDGA